MCGITGFAGIKADPAMITSMLGHIKHRGPNDQGYCRYENLAIGMTRLSIVDISGGAQPIHTDDGNLSIVFNGEIYNYPELAKEYLQQGGILKTRSDTEIILALYEQLREKCLQKLRGMYAFAILNRREKSIFIARDRVGIKPLYFSYSDSTLLFGSEIKSILASDQLKVEPNLNLISDYLSMRYVPGPNSLFQGIKRLAPGHWMKWEAGNITQQCYWQPSIREKQSLSVAAFQEQFDALFKESIDIHRLGDVPHGAYLSGGLDSGAIVNALRQIDNTPLKTFTVGFGWDGDELSDARETATLLGTEHHEIICQPNDFEYLPQIIWHADEPLGDPIVLPTYILAKEASQHVKVILTGEGADEILGGYLFHKAVNLATLYQRWIPHILHQTVIHPVVSTLPVSILNAGFNYPGYLGESGKQRLLSFLKLARNNDPKQLLKFFMTLFDGNEKKALFNEAFHGATQDVSSWETPLLGTTLDKSLYLQYTDWLPDNILMRQDKMSMAHGLEARVPFLDHRLIEFLETVPQHLKLTLRRNKILLRNYANNHGIQKVAKRKKTAFYFPMEEYFNGQVFQELLANTLSKPLVEHRGLFNYKTIENLIQRMRGKDFLAGKQVFALMSLELWFQLFIDKKFNFAS